MINRRTFVKFGIVGLPLSGCSNPVAEAGEPLDAALRDTKAGLSPSVMQAARQHATDFRDTQQTVLNHEVPYDVAPRFFP